MHWEEVAEDWERDLLHAQVRVGRLVHALLMSLRGLAIAEATAETGLEVGPAGWRLTGFSSCVGRTCWGGGGGRGCY